MAQTPHWQARGQRVCAKGEGFATREIGQPSRGSEAFASPPCRSSFCYVAALRTLRSH